MFARIAAATLLAIVFVSTSSAQDAVASGFALTPQPFTGATSASASVTLTNGEFVVFDGLDVRRYDASGALLDTLATLPGFAFPSFLLLDADEQQLFVGESSNGDIYRIFTGFPSSLDLVVNLPFNFDAALAPDGILYVSAATCGFTCGNEIWRVDTQSGSADLVARVPGASGPVALDAEGGLLYGTASNQFPPPPGSSSIVRWSPVQLSRKLGANPRLGFGGHAWLELDDAEVVGNGFTVAYRLARDPLSDQLFLVENDFSTGANRIRWVRGDVAQSPVLVEGPAFRTMANVSFLPSLGDARFLPYQPAVGGTLVYTSTDFPLPPQTPLIERTAIEPLRPAASLSGPGTSGPGEILLDLASGPPSGFARLAFGPSSTYSPLETAYPVNGLPLFLGLAPATLGLGTTLYPLDAQGALTESFVNPGGLEGTLAIQLLLYDAGMNLVGSSAGALL
jgi:hypothetical protein